MHNPRLMAALAERLPGVAVETTADHGVDPDYVEAIGFAWLAWSGADTGVFTAAMVIDNICGGFAGVALIGYMSSLTNIGYTATQYALLSSFYALLGKVLKGFSGVTVETLQAATTLIDGYAWFFIVTALMGIPALLLCVVLGRRGPVPPRPA